jgi:hypothetical protein
MAKVKLQPLTDREKANASPLIMKMKGTPEWCWQTLDSLKRNVELISKRYEEVDDQLEDIKKYEIWNVIPPGAPYGSLDAMLAAELSTDADSLRGKIQELRSHGGDRRSGNFQVDNVNLKRRSKAGNSTEYLLGRLKRDRPELAIRVMEGEMSAHAAAIEAGFIKPPNPLQQILGLLPKLSKEETQKLINAAVVALTGAPAKPNGKAVAATDRGLKGHGLKGRIWINNGKERRRIDPASPIPEGWFAGRGTAA